MIPCNWIHDPTRTDSRGWPFNMCVRCSRELYAPDHPSKWKGDPQWCRAWPFPHELGHWLTLLLAAVGVHKSGYVWLKRKLGFAPKCGCDKRATWLNTLGTRLLSLARRKPAK